MITYHRTDLEYSKCIQGNLEEHTRKKDVVYVCSKNTESYDKVRAIVCHGRYNICPIQTEGIVNLPKYC